MLCFMLFTLYATGCGGGGGGGGNAADSASISASSTGGGTTGSTGFNNVTTGGSTGATTSSTGATTGSTAGTTGSTAGTTGSSGGTTGSTAGTTGSTAGTTGSTAGTTGSTAGTTGSTTSGTTTGGLPHARVPSSGLLHDAFSLDVGGTPVAVASADFNADGKMDVVAVNGVANSNNVVVFLNNTAAGSTVPQFTPTSFSVPGTPTAVVTGNFSGGNSHDVAIATDTPAVYVLQNSTPTASNTASLSVVTTLALSHSAGNALAAGDLSGGGSADLAVGDATSGSVLIFLNAHSGTPSFGSAHSFAAMSGGPTALASADVDNDGHLDLITADGSSNSITVWRNTALGAASGFVNSGSITVGADPVALAVADFNRDNLPDVAVADAGDSTATVLLNQSSGAGAIAWSGGLTVNLDSQASPLGIVAVDLSGDGVPDIATANAPTVPPPQQAENTYGSISIAVNTTAANSSTPSFAVAQQYTVGLAPAALASGDFNGDNRNDLVCADNFATNLALALNNGSGLDVGAQLAASSQQHPASAVAVDLDGDGKPDLVSGNVNSSSGPYLLSVYHNTTAPGASAPSFVKLADLSATAVPSSVCSGDFNGDGKPDIATVGVDTAQVTIYLNTTPSGGSISFDSGHSFTFTGNYDVSILAADLAGTGKADLVIADQHNNDVTIMTNTSSASTLSFSVSQVQIAADGNLTQPTDIALANMDGSGKLSIVVSCNDYVSGNDNSGNLGHIAILPNTSSGGVLSFGAPQVLDVSGTVNPVAVAVADLDGDGKPDVSLTDYTSGALTIVPNASTGAGSFALGSPLSIQLGATGNAVTAADLRDSGHQDLVVGRNDALMSLLLNTSTPGNFTFNRTDVLSDSRVATDFFGPIPLRYAVADFNNDGKLDVATPSAEVPYALDGFLSVFLGQ
jgi:hypothetical protein